MTKAEHLQWWIDHLDGAPAVSVKHDLTCNPIGISSLVSKVAGSLVQAWNRHLHSSDSSTDVGCSSESESDDDSVSAMRSFLFHGTTGKRLWQSWVSPAYRLCFLFFVNREEPLSTSPNVWRSSWTVHLGYLFGIRVKKNSELAELLRTYKGRVVFQGNQVYDQTYNYAIFQD